MPHLRRSSDHTEGKKGFNGLILLFSVVSVLSLALTGSSLVFRFNQTNQFRTEQKSVWFTVICSIEQAVQHNPKVHNKQQFYHFYDKLLVQKVHTKPCGFTSTRTERR